MSQLETNKAVQMVNITKTFGSLVANDKVCLDIHKGEILSLLGENGSGKTTLMNMLSGIYLPDSGQIFVDGKEVSIASPRDAFNLRIGMIHQHFKLVDVLTATENIILGLDGKSRMNQPSTVGKNWRWRALPGVFTPELAKKLRNFCRIYGRLPAEPVKSEI